MNDKKIGGFIRWKQKKIEYQLVLKSLIKF